MAIVKKNSMDKIVVDLDGTQGNAFYLIGLANQLSPMMGLDSKTVMREMKSGDYNNLLEVFENKFGDIVEMQTSNPDYL